MRVQVLISSMHKNPKELIRDMHIASDAILINQCDKNEYESFRIKDSEGQDREIRAYSFAERGVGLSRNNALLRADKDICLISDEDIVYVDGYEKLILSEFENHPKADVLLFNVEVCKERRTYFNEDFHRVRWYNCGRYPAYAIAIRREKMHQSNLTFSLLFGGGAKYSNGEDSLFLRDCLNAGLKMYASDVVIGKEEPRESTWFSGYNKKFFYDRGVLYHYLYGGMAQIFGLRFLLKNKSVMCGEISYKEALSYLKDGIYFAKHGRER